MSLRYGWVEVVDCLCGGVTVVPSRYEDGTVALAETQEEVQRELDEDSQHGMDLDDHWPEYVATDDKDFWLADPGTGRLLRLLPTAD